MIQKKIVFDDQHTEPIVSILSAATPRQRKALAVVPNDDEITSIAIDIGPWRVQAARYPIALLDTNPTGTQREMIYAVRFEMVSDLPSDTWQKSLARVGAGK